MSVDRAAADTMRSDWDAICDVMQALGLKIKGKAVSCPWHDDQNPSASILQEPGSGVWRVYCHVCDKAGDVFDLRAIRGPTVADQLKELSPVEKRETKREPPKPEAKRYPTMEALIADVHNPEAIYKYDDPDTGHVDLLVFRILKREGGKKFIQAGEFGDHWRMNAPEGLLPLYNRGNLAKSGEAVVVEGEKCVHSLMSIGLPATTSPGGAGKAGLANWQPLAGKVVYLWPDNDPVDPKTGKRTGLEHMRDVEKQLQEIYPEPRVYWIDPDGLGLGPKGDVADLLAGMSGQEVATRRTIIRGILDDSQPTGASVEVGRVIEDTIAGKRRSLKWKWPRLGDLTRATLPGTVTLLCGEPGSSKSFMLLEAMAYWHSEGIRCALYELEDDRSFHLYRALAQRSRDSRLFDDSWVEANPGDARSAYQEHGWFLDAFGRTIWEAPNQQITLDALAEWVKSRAKAGARVIAIDPITAAVASDKPWVSDLKFIMAAKTAVREHGASLIIVTHPTKTTQKKPGMSGMSGGAAYQRFAHTALWLEFLEEAKAVTVYSAEGARSIEANRMVTVMKSRNGKGHGMRIAYDFDGKSLCFNELGCVAAVEAKSDIPPSRAHHSDKPSDKEDLFRDQ